MAGDGASALRLGTAHSGDVAAARSDYGFNGSSDQRAPLGLGTRKEH